MHKLVIETPKTHVQPLKGPLCRQRRTLKIEADGDGWMGKIKPKLRLTGHWLEKAGFRPGTYASVTCVSTGVIQIHSLRDSSEKS